MAEGIQYPRGRGAGPDPDALTRLIPIANPFHEQARPLAGLTPWATAFRYPTDDPLTAEPLPTKADLERHVEGAEALAAVVARHVTAAT